MTVIGNQATLELFRRLGAGPMSNAEQSLSSRTTAPPGSGGGQFLPLQRKLVAGKLNIVGESHPENERFPLDGRAASEGARQRRADEREFTSDQNFGGYWTEDAPFMISNSAYFGDEPKLRAAQSLSASADTLMSMRRGNLAEHGRLAELGEQLHLESARIYDPEKRYQIARLANYLLRIARLAPQFMVASGADDVEARSRRNQFDRSLELAAARSLAWASARLKGAAPTADRISETRSGRMLTMARWAATSEGVRGIWKVGQSHVDDLPSEPDTSQVALASSTEFETVFSAWLKSSGRLEARQPTKSWTDDLIPTDW